VQRRREGLQFGAKFLLGLARTVFGRRRRISERRQDRCGRRCGARRYRSRVMGDTRWRAGENQNRREETANHIRYYNGSVEKFPFRTRPSPCARVTSHKLASMAWGGRLTQR